MDSNVAMERRGGAERDFRGLLDLDLLGWCEQAIGQSDMRPAAHHRAMLAALQRMEGGAAQRLMVLMPPGSAKSTYASVLFPAWWLARHPRHSIIAASHTARLAEHFGRSVRSLLTTHAEQLGFHARQDAHAAGNFLTSEGGGYFAVGVLGAVTGRRADLAVIDDPIASFAQADSTARRDRLWDWFRSELATRMKPSGRMLLVMTRWHADDLAGRLIEQGGWDTLRFPALAEADDALGRAPGEALWPDWEGRDLLLQKRLLLGERVFAALFQQAPLGPAGTLFDVSKLDWVDATRPGTAVRAWDLAASGPDARDADWTVGLRLLRAEDGSFVVEDVIRLRVTPQDVLQLIRRAAEADGEDVAIGLPQDPGQAGKSQVLYLAKMLAGFRVDASPERGSKAARAALVAAQVAAGNVGLRRAGWNRAFLDELAAFPNGSKDDQVDALSRAFGMLTSRQGAARFVSMPFGAR